ncbi:hypothetical protein P167DRAFT_334166 [Morchella conica CCBAS932]|uniref:Uncharacterized protein n=1 Tax=Morchella conica CCBAS932 TaxID=1392247 RepID=A0A3N4KKB1_9PEZI|nr:hypothetical protein P167DRAFT_334166 [Morchella conica CCBAS932]
MDTVLARKCFLERTTLRQKLIYGFFVGSLHSRRQEVLSKYDRSMHGEYSRNSICRISIRRIPCYPVRNPLGFWFFLLQDQFAIPEFLLSRMKSFESWQSGISSCDCTGKALGVYFGLFRERHLPHNTGS